MVNSWKFWKKIMNSQKKFGLTGGIPPPPNFFPPTGGDLGGDKVFKKFFGGTRKFGGGDPPPCQSKFFLRIHEFFPKFPRVDHNYAKIGHKNSVSDKIRLKIFCALRARRKNDQNFAKICVPPLYGLSPPEIPPLSKLSPPGCPPPKGGDNF